jgi:hypothetical protein
VLPSLKKFSVGQRAARLCICCREERARIQYAKQPNYTENEISKTGIPEYIAQTRFGRGPINIIFPIHHTDNNGSCAICFNGQSAKQLNPFVFMDLKMRQPEIIEYKNPPLASRKMIFNLSSSLNAI